MVWFEHYLFGCFAQTFNGTVTTAVALLAEAVDGKLPGGPTWANIWHPLVISMLSFALIYFKSHPFPDDLTTITTTTSTTATGTQPVPPGTIVASAVVAPATNPPAPATAAARMNAAAQ
jgi:hypothetical protein